MCASRASLVLVLAVAAWGCRGVGGDPERSGLEVALDKSHAATSNAVRKGFGRTERQKSYSVRARYNPSRCSAPDFEVWAYGKWTRADLEPLDAAAAREVEAFRERVRDAAFEELAVVGVWSARRKRTARGVEWPIFELTSARAVRAVDAVVYSSSASSEPCLDET